MSLFGKTMTSKRRQNRPLRGAIPATPPAALAVAACLVAVVFGGFEGFAATTELIVTDPRTGLAIDGYDPVAYFIDAEAAPGRAEFELSRGGVVWRFRNFGNQAAFMENPADYEPRFGGYDPVAIARGAPTPGNPLIWLTVGQKLYLFYSPQSEAAFKADAGRLLAQADAHWPDVTKALAR
jgi:hypothetical protein